jgi:hypothetical protein
MWDDDECFDCAGITRRELRSDDDPWHPRFCSWCFDYAPAFKLIQVNTTSPPPPLPRAHRLCARLRLLGEILMRP